MKSALIYIADPSPVLTFAAAQLASKGYRTTTFPSPAVTHVLLPIPTKTWSPPEGLPENVTIFGGNLPHSDQNTIDLLKDEAYLWENAIITAHCALKIAMNQLPVIFPRLPVLVIGWGRIGKALCRLLAALDADVTVASRSPALIPAEYRAVDTSSIDPAAYRLIFNTAPFPVLDGSQASADTVLIDLASKQGISGNRVIWARGLPGKEAPESSGALIAKTVMHYLSGKEKL